MHDVRMTWGLHPDPLGMVICGTSVASGNRSTQLHSVGRNEVTASIPPTRVSASETTTARGRKKKRTLSARLPAPPGGSKRGEGHGWHQRWVIPSGEVYRLVGFSRRQHPAAGPAGHGPLLPPAPSAAGLVVDHQTIQQPRLWPLDGL